MSRSQISVLIVDDQIDDARAFRSLVESRARLTTALTADPDEALQIVQTNAVTVLVLDQRMPVTGTELYRVLEPWAPYAHAVLLTQEHDADVMQQAFGGEGKQFKRYLHKGSIEDLPAIVLSLHAQSLSDRARDARESPDAEPLLTVRRWGVRRREVRLIARHEITSRFVDDAEYEPVGDIAAGEIKKTGDVRTSKRVVSVEHELEGKVATDLKLEVKHVGELKTALESRARQKTATELEFTGTRTLEKQLELPASPASGVRHVRSRLYETAPAYRRQQLTVESYCHCCGQSSFATIDLRLGTDLVALRETDYWSDGTVAVHATGWRRV